MSALGYANVTSFKDRHGKTRYRFRRVGLPTHSFVARPGTPEFDTEYAAAISGAPITKRPKRTAIKRPAARQASLQVFKGRSLVYVVGHIYGPVKIGWTTDVHARLKDFQTAQHKRLRIFALLDGGAALERELHNRFASHRVSGEWFRWTAEIRDYLAENLANLIDENLANFCKDLK